VARPALSAATALSEVPATALAAYQRASAVLGRAAASCHLDASLLAAVGYVDSLNGTAGGHSLSADGVETPALYGPSLGTPDSDAGRLDGDPVHDRAVGPLLLTPATWSLVGVDADGDGVRDPQDVDDAALALGVQLCAQRDLSSRQGLRSALWAVDPTARFRSAVLRAYAVYRAAPPPVTTPPAVLAARPLLPLSAPGARGHGAGATSPNTPTPPAVTAGAVAEVGALLGHPAPSPGGSPTPSGTPSGSPSGAPSGSPSASPSDTPTDATTAPAASTVANDTSTPTP
jgi:hypothetical protein